MAITMLVGGFSYVYYDGFSSIKIEEQSKELIHLENKKLIDFITTYKSHSSKQLNDINLLENSYENLIRSYENLSYLDLKSLDVMKKDISALHVDLLKSVEINNNKKNYDDELSKRKREIENKLASEIKKRLKYAQEFMPEVKKKLADWSSDIPFLKNLERTIDKSYVDKRKFHELQGLMELSQLLIKNNYFLSSKEIAKSGVRKTLQVEIEVLVELISEQKEKIEKSNKHTINIRESIRSHREKLDLALNDTLLVRWQEYRSLKEESELKQRNKKHRIVLDIITWMGTFIILVLLVVFLKIFPYLEKLRKHAKDISTGNFDRKFNKIPKNEFGQVMSAFNHMSEEIMAHIEQLGEEKLKKVALAESIQKMKKLNAIGELSSKMGHELKNPISILNFCLTDAVELLNKGDSDGTKKELLKSIHTLDRLVQLTKKLESRGNNITFEELDFSTVTGEVIGMYENQVSIRFLYPELPALFNGPRLELQSAISNLIDNAIESGSEDIEIRILIEDRKIKLVIANTGDPLKEEDVIFNNFYSTKDGDGRGLGLAIVKDIVEICQGTISYHYENHHHVFTLVFLLD